MIPDPTNRQPIVPVDEYLAIARQLKTTTRLDEAAGDADLVIEACPVQIDLKQTLFRQMDPLTPPHTILAATSSSIPVSVILPGTEKDAQGLNLHFHIPTIITNMVDVMGCASTRPEVVHAGRAWNASP